VERAVSVGIDRIRQREIDRADPSHRTRDCQPLSRAFKLPRSSRRTQRDGGSKRGFALHQNPQTRVATGARQRCALIATPRLAVLKSQVGLLVGRLGFAIGALAFPTCRWERRSRGEMIIGQDVRYQRIDESFVAVLAVQKPACHPGSIYKASNKRDRCFPVFRCQRE
jgi:hypothetical protein